MIDSSRSRDFLSGLTVAVSISDSPDLPRRGMSEVHMRDAIVEIARHLVSAGARLLYAGDLRPSGYTALLAEVIARHHPLNSTRSPLVNLLPWTTHLTWAREEFEERATEFGGVAQMHRLDPSGKYIRNDAWPHVRYKLADDAVPSSLTAMRKVATEICDARIALGGKVDKYQGVMPGVAEEVLMALKAGKPLYLLGGFGGCTGDIAETMGLAQTSNSRSWDFRKRFSKFSDRNLKNGLPLADSKRLAVTAHIDEAVVLILRGLRAVKLRAEN